MSSTTHHLASPSAVPPPPPPPLRRTGRWVAGVVVLLVLITVAAVTFGVRFAESLRQETATETVPDVQELVIETDEGSVSLRAGDGTGVGIRTTKVWSGGSQPTLERHLDAGVLTLSSDCAWLDFGCGVEYEIAVPAGTAVRVRTVDGPIDADGLVSPRFEASTVDGRVTASFGEPPEHVGVRSVDGSISLTLPPASYRVAATTIDGHMRVDVPDDPSASREISVDTVDGRVDVLAG